MARKTKKAPAWDPAWLAQMKREYHPCDLGLHVCGVIEDEHGDRPLTVANLPAADEASARALFAALRPEFEDPDGELLVDLNLGAADHVAEQFGMHRQMLDRLLARAEEAQP